MNAAPPHALLLFRKRDTCNAPRKQQHAEKGAEPCGIGLGGLDHPGLVSFTERHFMQHGEVWVDVVKEGTDQGHQSRRFYARGAVVAGRMVVDVGSGAWCRERVRVVVALEEVLVGGRVPPEQDGLAGGALAAEGAQLDVEGEGARGADVLHLSLLVGQQ